MTPQRAAVLIYQIENHPSGVQLVTFRGRVTFGRQTEQCRSYLKDLLAKGERRFCFDLSAVEYVDSAGIGFLVSCLTTLGQAGARLRLAAPPERVRYVLGITRLDTVFEIFDTAESALDWKQ
jgi:anti-sigma B factor antagonist